MTELTHAEFMAALDDFAEDAEDAEPYDFADDPRHLKDDWSQD